MGTFQLTLLVLTAIVAGVTSAIGQSSDAAQDDTINALLEKHAKLERRLEEAEAAVKQSAGLVQDRQLSTNATIVLPVDPANITDPLDYMWLIVCGSMVMFMHAGFAVLEAGSCRQKNASTVLLKNILTVCIGTIMWYLLGYGIAYGVAEDPSEITGSELFVGAKFISPVEDVDGTPTWTATQHPKEWFFQWAFCATSSTIVSGAVAERIQLPSYMAFTAIMTGIIYPFVVYWTWSGEGWLTTVLGDDKDGNPKDGYSDFAGSGIVHLTGGVAALVGAAMCGARTSRWETPEDFYPHNMGLVVLGTFILWFGFYGFNCGSTLTLSSSSDATTAGLVAMNTTMSGSAGGLTVFLIHFIMAKIQKKEQVYDLCGACNGILAGLVAICAGANNFEPGLALVVGLAGGIFYEAGHLLLPFFKIDDPLDAFSVHGMGGIAGLLLRPLLCIGGASWEMFAAHFIGMLAIMGWSGALSLAFFLPARLMGVLSYSEKAQAEGSDVHCTPPKAYSMS